MSASPAKRDTLNIRIKPEERSLIDRAARSLGKNRTDFILEPRAVPPKRPFSIRPS